VVEQLRQPHSSVAHQHALFEERLDYLLHEEGIAFGAFDDEPLERGHFTRVTNERRKHLRGAFLAQRIEPELCVVSLVAPLMEVFGAVIDQQQDAGRGEAVDDQIE
jgi:hypothetical protein